MPVWQKLNVTAFLMSGIVGSAPDIIGERYVDVEGHSHMGLSVQPVIVLTARPTVLRNARNRARERSVDTAVYIERCSRPDAIAGLQSLAMCGRLSVGKGCGRAARLVGAAMCPAC